MKLLCAAFLAAACSMVFSPTALASDLCPADKDGDGSVGTTDLNLLLGAWGTSEPRCDFNGDGDVGCFDLEYLLGNWGPCPTCLGDLDGDGVVGSADLAILLGTWGNDCRVDLDQDGDIDQDDIDAFLCLWGTSGPLGDFDGDGNVGTADLTILLAAFGRDCRGDLDRDGSIGQTDLNLLLAAWGKC